MDMIKIPGFQFNDELREVPSDLKEWESFCEGLKTQLKGESSPDNRLQLIEHIGMALRILNRLDEAEVSLLKAVSLSFTLSSPNRIFQNLIRLAHVYQWKKEFEKAQLLFDQAKGLMNEKPLSEQLVAGYHQHLGKLFFDQKLFGKAQTEFSTALRMREKVSSPEDQLESTKMSLEESLKRWGRSFDKGLMIRRALPGEGQAIHRAHMKSIQELCSKDHSPEEIRAWGSRPYSENHRSSAIKNELVWVIDINKSIEGYGHLHIEEKNGVRRAHIMGLYLTPKAAGHTLGKSLLEIMFEESRSAAVKEIALESTITAQKFYSKFGFKNEGPESTLEIGGTPIRCYPMKMMMK